MTQPVQDKYNEIMVGSRMVDDVGYSNKFGSTGEFTDKGNDTPTTTIWPGSELSGAELYTPSVTNDISHISSTDNDDTGFVQIEGLDVDGIDHTQVVILAGQTKTALGTPLRAVNRMRYFVDSTVSPTGCEGTIYCYVDGTVSNGKPTDNSTIRAIIREGDNQTQQLHYTVPHNKVGVIKGGEVYFVEADTGKQADLSWRGAAALPGFTGYYAPINIGNVGLNSDLRATFMKFYTIPERLAPGTRLWIQVDRVQEEETFIAGSFDIQLVGH